MSEKYLDLTGLGYFLEKLDDRYASSSDIPTTYLASASVSGNTLTLTKADSTTQTFTPTFTDTNYYPSRSYSSGLQISTSQGISNTCALYVPNASSSQAGVVSTAAQTFAGVKSFNNGIKLLETGSYYATLQGDSSVSSDITLTLPSSTGTLALIDDLPTGEVDVTINGTATQTTEALVNIIVGTTTYTKPIYSFTGSSVTSDTPSGTISVASNSHTHTVTGSVGLTGTRTTSGSGTTARRTLNITGTFSNGTTSSISGTIHVATYNHTHSVTASGDVA